MKLDNIKRIYKGKYFYSAVIAIGFCLGLSMVLYLGSAPFLSQLKESDVSPPNSLRAVRFYISHQY